MGDRLLLRGGHVLTVDPELGDLPTGDVLIEGDTIAGVAPHLDADAEVIDVSGQIVIPGFVDTHRHTWEAAIRGCAPDATLRGLQEACIRAQYAYGSANTSLADYWNESKIAIPGDDVRRVRETYFSSDDGLLTMALATRGTGFCIDDVCRAEWGTARELGIPITVHVAMGRLAGRFAMIKAVEYGLRPGLSIDVVTTVPGDMFTQIRAAFGCERARVNEIAWAANTEVPETMLTARQMLEMATINGAHVAGLEARTGSLTPGKKADVVVIDGRALNVAPIIDPVAAVTLCADVSNVDTVIINGQVRKRDGKLLADVAGARRLVEASRDHLIARVQEKQSQSA